MTAQIITHPSAAQRGLQNARDIIHAPEGTFEVAEVIDACDFLLTYGDCWDVARAMMLKPILVDICVAEANADARNQVEWDMAETNGWYWGEIAALVLGVIVGLIVVFGVAG